MTPIALEQVGLSARPAGPGTPVRDILSAIDLELEDGVAHALLGPAGAGKSSLLNIISGLVRPSRGRLLFSGRDALGLGIADRGIAHVLEQPVVYEGMRAVETLAFPLRNRGLRTGEVQTRIGEISAALELEGLLERDVAQLSTEQRRRLALARGFVRDRVNAVLLDEPLEGIEPRRRSHLRSRLKRLVREAKAPVLIATHDQADALTLAERISVIEDGRILQTGSCRELFERPAHRAVGRIVGIPAMNFMTCHLVRDGLGIDGTDAVIGGAWAARAREHPRSRLEIGIRPEFVSIVGEEEGEGLAAKIVRIDDFGRHLFVTARAGPHLVTARLPEDTPVPADRARLDFAPEGTLLYADERLVA